MNANESALLEIDSLSVQFAFRRNLFGKAVRPLRAVDNVCLSIPAGRTLGLVGESGCGKSTMARALMGLTAIHHGHVRFNGQDITGLSPRDRARARIAMQIVFQDPQSSLDPRMVTWQVITEPLLVAGKGSPSQRRSAAKRLAEQVGIAGTDLDRYPHEFSGGQRQRIAIARALSAEPRFLVLDEPTSALDLSVQAQILNLLVELQDQLKLTYLFISHNLAVIRHLADEVAVMFQGKVIESGLAGAVLDQPQHPYTQRLVGSTLSMIQGARPAESDLSTLDLGARNTDAGCQYRLACREALPACLNDQTLAPIPGGAQGHSVRCRLRTGTPNP